MYKSLNENAGLSEMSQETYPIVKHERHMQNSREQLAGNCRKLYCLTTSQTNTVKHSVHSEGQEFHC